jgi:hypothetical protein
MAAQRLYTEYGDQFFCIQMKPKGLSLAHTFQNGSTAVHIIYREHGPVSASK